MSKHQTVLKRETIEMLNLKDGDILLDLTFGGGGHSLEALRKNDLKVIAFDVDQKNFDQFSQDYPEETGKISFINKNFSQLKSVLKEQTIFSVNAIIADLGWSSDQLESLQGLSYQNKNDQLDMRMDKNLLVQAKDILNTAGKDELSDMFARYADFNGAENQRLISEIKNFRNKKLFERVADLVEVADRAFNLKKIESKSRKHTIYGRIFQALRIKVNSEFENLAQMLTQSWDVLVQGGRIAVITFHSGEDKVIREFINLVERNSSAKVLSSSIEGNFVRPTVEELTENLRARSAKLFIIEKNK